MAIAHSSSELETLILHIGVVSRHVCTIDSSPVLPLFVWSLDSA